MHMHHNRGNKDYEVHKPKNRPFRTRHRTCHADGLRVIHPLRGWYIIQRPYSKQLQLPILTPTPYYQPCI